MASPALTPPQVPLGPAKAAAATCTCLQQHADGVPPADGVASGLQVVAELGGVLRLNSSHALPVQPLNALVDGALQACGAQERIRLGTWCEEMHAPI